MSHITHEATTSCLHAPLFPRNPITHLTPHSSLHPYWRRITNQSGLKLSYWVEPSSGDAHLLRPFQSEDLHVEPQEKSVIMPDSQQHITARTICMQFEGNWTPVQVGDLLSCSLR